MSLRTSRGCVFIFLAALMPMVLSAQSAPGPATATPPSQAAPPAASPVPAPTEQSPAQTAAQISAQPQGGTIHGIVLSGAVGKPGSIPLPGVAVTATNTLTGKKYAAATDINGVYSMAIPQNGRYVVRAELAGFAPKTQEVVLSGSDATAGVALVKTSDFGLELASRAAAAEARAEARAEVPNTSTTASSRGLQNLSLSAGDLETTDASSGAANSDVALPSLGNMNDSGSGEAAADSNESIAVSGQVGQTNGLANYSEDEIRQHVSDALSQARASGQLAPGADPTSEIAGVLGGMMSEGGFGGGRHGSRSGGGSRGGGGGGGRGFGGSGAFRNFNPAQPHGSIFYQGGNSALNSAPWSPTLVPQVNPSAYSNRYGLTIGGSPYIPGLIAPSTKQFGFLNITGQKNLNAYLPSPVRVPTLLERAGDFSRSVQLINGSVTPVTLYDPRTGTPIAGNNLANASTPLSPQALALLSYYPAPNVTTTDATAYNYQTISNAGSNNVAVNSRFVRTIGQSTGSPFSRGGRGGGHRSSNGPPSLRQNISLGFNYSHAASDIRKIFLPLSGATESNGYSLSVGYTIGYGRFSNSISASWNRSSSETRNYFTNTTNDPATAVGIDVPNESGGFADPSFYNGLPTIGVTNFASLSNESPSESIHQTISVSDSVSWRHAKHNLRFGMDVRRVHADSIGGGSPLGSFSFTGYATESPADQGKTASGSSSQAGTGSGFADFLLGLPTQTSIQAGLYKMYLRENVLSAYAQDDFRMMANVTLTYGVRWEYFSPYVEKDNHMVNLDHNADFTSVDPVLPNERGTYGGIYPRSLVEPDRAMFAPRFGIAWAPKASSRLLKSTVVRAGYGINYNTGQYGSFARQLSFQPPFATTQTNTLTTELSNTGCTTTTPTTTANMTLANGFGCSSQAIQNDYSVNKNYRLGMVQVYNLNIQRTLPLGVVLNIGYDGSKGSDLDVVGAPNHTTTAVTTADAQSFLYEDSVAGAHLNQLLVSAQKRLQKGIALGVFYQYSHSIDNASSIGGADASTVQDYQRLDLEEGNSAFDVRHKLTGSWVLELPFGPNRAYLNKGGVWSHLLDGFNLSGSFGFATGSYFTPQYASSAAQELAGGDYTLRPDRVFTQPLKGPGTLKEFFNKAAFTQPGGDSALEGFGTASRDSIEGPGVVQANASLSRIVELGETRSFEARVTATNVFNTVQYSGINTTVTSANYGQVTSAAGMRSLLVQARYRF